MNYFNEQYFTPQYWSAGYFDGIVSAGEEQTAYPGLFADADLIYSPVASASYEIAAQLFTDQDAIYVPDVVAWTEIKPPLFTDADVFYHPAIWVPFDQELSAALFVDVDLFFSPVLFGKVTMGKYTITSPTVIRSSEYGDPIRLIEYPDVFNKEEN